MLQVKTIPAIESIQNNMYTLSVRLEEPERLIYLCTRKQAEGKSYETDIKFSTYKPGDRIADLKPFILEFVTFVN